MIKTAYADGAAVALARFGLDKDAGIKEKLMPLMLAGGLLGGAGAGGKALAHHMSAPRPAIQAPSVSEMPNAGNAIQQHMSRLDAAANAR